MRWLKNFVRFMVAVQLLPALESGEETLVGGQAVLEGVMMRSPHAWSIACRKPSGEIATMTESLDRPSEKHKWMAWPIVRGVMTLGYAMSLGYRALRFSANVAIEDFIDDGAGKDHVEKAHVVTAASAVPPNAKARRNSHRSAGSEGFAVEFPRKSRHHQQLAGRRQHYLVAGLLHLHVQIPPAAGGDRTEEG